ncbi:hypothetical protein INT43_002445 [Umbelopsis isabellina]|uniref:Homologous-pairing protein 2 homolog n=1 Tax=Mortierella isabellina TaxID=91625 RepID=A0A8H7ULC3_MORIS|nr:hypothetical protein INT43_002445 [Umbelopsis isabellina]
MTKAKKSTSVQDKDADIHTNLNNTLTKTSVAKALDKLTDKQLAFSKTYGKSIIYSVAQDENNVVTPDEMAKLDSQMEKLSQKLSSLKEAKVEKVNELKSLNSTLPTLEAQSLLTQLKVQNHEAAQRLASCQTQNGQISVHDKQRIEKEYDTNINLWKSRKKLFNEIFKTVTEHLPGKVSDFKDEIGIEEDPQSLESVLVE